MFSKTVKKKSKGRAFITKTVVPSSANYKHTPLGCAYIGLRRRCLLFPIQHIPMGCAYNWKQTVPLLNNFVTDPETFKAAGVAFTNGTHALAGYQPHKKHPSISGIGGSREPGESYMQTALRECVEELFEPTSIPRTLFPKLAEIAPQKVIQSKSYINAIYSFDDLQAILIIMKRHGLRSPLYEKFPKNITELIMNRIPKVSEISHLALLPVVAQAAETFMDPYFVADMSAFM